MTDYETASLALQQSALALQQSAIDAAYVQAAVAGAVGLLQALIVGWGIRSMSRMGDKREVQHQNRHEEVMVALQQQGEALRALIERTAPRG